MAVDPERARTDLLPGQRWHPDDQRVRHADVVCYVRKVRHPSQLVTGSSWWAGADPIALLALPVVLTLLLVRRLAAARAARRDDWVLGILALPSPDTFQSWSGPREVHREQVRGDEAARRRIGELVEEIRAGERPLPD